MPIRIATRQSPLALTQTNMVASLLTEPFEIVKIQTTGDIKAEESLKKLGGKEVFTREIDNALLSGQADIAVHSLKDVPGITHPDLEIIACLPRADARDVLIGNAHESALFGTSSPRRMAQLSSLYPNARFTELRGNVETRLRKIAEKQVDATLLAMAGLNRLGITPTLPHRVMELHEMTPAVGQAIICVMAKKGGIKLDHINHQPSFTAAIAERAVLKAFGGNCHTPVAAHATISGNQLSITGFVATEDGAKHSSKTLSGALADSEKLGCELGAELLYWFGNNN